MSPELELEVRRRARDCCEDCLIPQAADVTPHKIDNVIALKHIGPTDEGNLAVACSHCNRHKGPNIAGIDPETGSLTPLYHPRVDEWPVHFQLMSNGTIAGRSPVGRTTIQVLNINEADAVALRASLVAEGMLSVAAG